MKGRADKDAVSAMPYARFVWEFPQIPHEEHDDGVPMDSAVSERVRSRGGLEMRDAERLKILWVRGS